MLEKYDPFVFNSIKWLESKVQKKIKSLKVEISNLTKQKETIRPQKEQLINLESNQYWGTFVVVCSSIIRVNLYYLIVVFYRLFMFSKFT